MGRTTSLISWPGDPNFSNCRPRSRHSRLRPSVPLTVWTCVTRRPESQASSSFVRSSRALPCTHCGAGQALRCTPLQSTPLHSTALHSTALQSSAHAVRRGTRSLREVAGRARTEGELDPLADTHGGRAGCTMARRFPAC